MSLFASLLGCFSGSGSKRVGCVGKDRMQSGCRSKDDDHHEVAVGDEESKENVKSKPGKPGKPAPIPMTYFPSGSRPSLL
ncbi:hypothetical protein ACJRO7_021935 [Eucalyptus globulus]|uniref:Uncharacterized protein n=1 Tax=Eucalyptus globulus TaxID=34317 RepID=A0ABD3KRB6_EUCGL